MLLLPRMYFFFYPFTPSDQFQNFSCNLTRNTLSDSMKNLAFHSLHSDKDDFTTRQFSLGEFLNLRMKGLRLNCNLQTRPIPGTGDSWPTRLLWTQRPRATCSFSAAVLRPRTSRSGDPTSASSARSFPRTARLTFLRCSIRKRETPCFRRTPSLLRRLEK